MWKRLPVPLRRLAILVLVPRAHVGAGMLVTDAEGRVLLVRQTYARPGHWALPGGWAKRGEEPRHAAERETFEELGTRLRAGPVLAIGRGIYGEVVVIFGTTDAISTAGIRPNAEIAEVRYFAPEALPPVIGRDDSLIQAALTELRARGGLGRG